MVENESTFWVGPASDPDRFRLTHLLGSGGEGEVWRAVRGAGDDEVAIKINPIPDSGPSEQSRLQAMTELDVGGLVRIHATFTGAVRHRLDDAAGAPTHQYVVMDYIDGLTLRTWLDEHPSASARQRVRILRGLAGALSRLHHGPRGRTSITHGDVKPANVIITSDGKPVLVDLGLLRTAGSGPTSGHTAAYSSPELRNPDSSPSSRADTFSFAVTAMETLTSLTPPLDAAGNLDVAETRRRMLEAPALRWRPILRRQLLRSLGEEPRGRPPTPVRVFVGRAIGLALTPLLLLLGAGGTALALQDDPAPVVVVDPGPRTAPPVQPSVLPPVTFTAKPTPRPKKKGVLPGTMLTADFSGGTFFYLDLPNWPACTPTRSNVVPGQLRALRIWGDSGDSYVDLHAKRDLEIVKVEPATRKIDGPRRLRQELSVYCPEPGPPVVEPPLPPPSDICHPEKLPLKPYAEYRADLDKATFTLLPDKDKRPFGISVDPCALSTSLRLAVTNCSRNLQYGLEFTYRVRGTKQLYTQTLGSYELWGWAENARFEVTLDGLDVIDVLTYTGAPQGCGTGGQPYKSIYREIDRLFAKAVFKRRHADGLSHQAAIKLVAARAGTTARRVFDACARAEENHEKLTCGRLDPDEQRPAAPTPSPTPSDPVVVVG